MTRDSFARCSRIGTKTNRNYRPAVQEVAFFPSLPEGVRHVRFVTVHVNPPPDRFPKKLSKLCTSMLPADKKQGNIQLLAKVWKSFTNILTTTQHRNASM